MTTGRGCDEPVSASVIVRSKNKESTIGFTLRALRRQSVPVEIVLVDSGSTDGTLQIAERTCDEIVRIRPEDFSYGGALNVGAERASGDVLFALSAHCVPKDDDWVAASLVEYRDPQVAGTNGEVRGPRGSR